MTDGQTEFSSLDHVCIPCSAVKNSKRKKSKKQLSVVDGIVLHCTVGRIHKRLSFFSLKWLKGNVVIMVCESVREDEDGDGLECMK